MVVSSPPIGIEARHELAELVVPAFGCGSRHRAQRHRATRADRRWSCPGRWPPIASLMRRTASPRSLTSSKPETDFDARPVGGTDGSHFAAELRTQA